jgi:protein SCO1/2
VEKPAFKGVDITGADYAQGWTLTDQHGQVRTLKDFAGKAVVVFFGFTQCPDVCPTALQEMVQAKQLLGNQADKLQGVFITVDPERDTAEVLTAYMANFGPDFVALRPTPEQLPKVAKDFKIYFKKVEGQTPTSYTMDHSAGSFTFDPQGRIRLYNRHASGAAALAEDVKILLKSP